MYFQNLAKMMGYSNKDILVIVNIDDIGMHRDVTIASFKTIDCGMVKSGSIMVPCPDFEPALTLLKEKPEFDMGVHLTLTCEWGEKYPWSPVLPKMDVPSLYNNQGYMWPNVHALLNNAKRKEIYYEMEAQIDKVLSMGLKPSHLDHHMDFYYNTDLFSDVMELSRKHNLPMRVWRRRKYKMPFIKNNLISLRRRGYLFPDTQMGLYNVRGQRQTYEFRKVKYYEHLRSLKAGVHNIKIHIAYDTEEMQSIMGKQHSSIRQIDYDVWSSDETKKVAKERGITFIGFRPLQQLQQQLMIK